MGSGTSTTFRTVYLSLAQSSGKGILNIGMELLSIIYLFLALAILVM